MEMGGKILFWGMFISNIFFFCFLLFYEMSFFFFLSFLGGIFNFVSSRRLAIQQRSWNNHYPKKPALKFQCTTFFSCSRCVSSRNWTLKVNRCKVNKEFTLNLIKDCISLLSYPHASCPHTRFQLWHFAKPAGLKSLIGADS